MAIFGDKDKPLPNTTFTKQDETPVTDPAFRNADSAYTSPSGLAPNTVNNGVVTDTVYDPKTDTYTGVDPVTGEQVFTKQPGPTTAAGQVLNRDDLVRRARDMSVATRGKPVVYANNAYTGDLSPDQIQLDKDIKRVRSDIEAEVQKRHDSLQEAERDLQEFNAQIKASEEAGRR